MKNPNSFRVSVPPDYYQNMIRTQLVSLLDEPKLKDTTVTLRSSSLRVNSFLLCMISPVLRVSICGNFSEAKGKTLNMDDIAEEGFLKLMRLAIGKEEVVAESVAELFELGEIAERLQMDAVRTAIESLLWKELRTETCVEMLERSEATGLHWLQGECYNTLCHSFVEISQRDSFMRLSEEALGQLLDEGALGAIREEDVFEAVVRWMIGDEDRLRGEGLLQKIRYGLIADDRLVGMASSGHPALSVGMISQLIGEARAKLAGNMSRKAAKRWRRGKGRWDGTERLCSKWQVRREATAAVLNLPVNTILEFDVDRRPQMVAIDHHGNILICDRLLQQIVVLNREGSLLRTIGPIAGMIKSPDAIAVDRKGRIAISDHEHDHILVLNADGSVASCFGTRGHAVGQLYHPSGVAFDDEGHIVVADQANNRIQVFDEHGTVVRHFGSRGEAVGQLSDPTGVVVDRSGRIVVTDQHNHRIQVFNRDGSVALCFGSFGSGAGQFDRPCGVAVDRHGRFVVVDERNCRVQVFDACGKLIRIVGGKGARRQPGEFTMPENVAVDGSGRILVSEGMRSRVQVLWAGP